MKRSWWKEVVVYQIYPRSFKDSTGDGNGDLRGIISKLDYIKSLGCNAIWLSPFFKSPMIDNGYDISDFRKINPMFGTMKDFEDLISEAKKRGIAIINDAVFSHTSNMHEWFKESRKSTSNKYSDYYIWRDNPLHTDKLSSLFSNNPWTYCNVRKQFYFHIFAVEQPDLNWQNPMVRKEMADVINFWIEKGVRGFRFDVIDNLGKDPDRGIMNSGEMLHAYIKELRENSWKDKDILTVAEAWAANEKNALLYCGKNRKELSMIFQFEHIIVSNRTSLFHSSSCCVEKIRETLYKWQEICKNDGWNSNFIQNHDLSRVVSAWGDDQKYWYLSATALATINHLLKGTPYIYQGEEIGMTNCPFKLNEFNDVQTIEKYKELVIDKKIMTHKEYLEIQNKNGRDNARTPMQWDNSRNAGFTNGPKTWLKVNPNYKKINVRKQMKDETSILSYYKKLVALRKTDKYKDIIIYGVFNYKNERDKDVFHFIRKFRNKKIRVLVNWSNRTVILNKSIQCQKVILSNYNFSKSSFSKLQPYEAIILVD